MEKSLILLALAVIATSDSGKIQNSLQSLKSFVKPRYEILYYREDKGHTMAEVTLSYSLGVPNIEDCNLYGDNILIGYTLLDVSKDKIIYVNKSEMASVVQKCTERMTKTDVQYSDNLTNTSIKSTIEEYNSIPKTLLIYPGTKWCGAGNIAQNYSDLGQHTETDKCCRTHDHCNDTILPNQKKYGLWNSAVFIKSHCDCDYEFAKCLHADNSNPSTSVGKLFFNILQVQCFKKDYPIIGCRINNNMSAPYFLCQQYIQDKLKPKQWQFFDPVIY